VLWRICWIHPFEDGNGRTVRAASYLVLSMRLGFELPGKLPIPARIKHAPIADMRALEAADAAWSRGVLDVSAMQRTGSSMRVSLPWCGHPSVSMTSPVVFANATVSARPRTAARSAYPASSLSSERRRRTRRVPLQRGSFIGDSSDGMSSTASTMCSRATSAQLFAAASFRSRLFRKPARRR